MTSSETLREPEPLATPNLRTPPPVVLTVAGSDSSAGAGIQADLKTFTACRVFGLTAVTCVVAETPLEVRSIHAVPPEILEDQLSLLLALYPIAAVKTGMLLSAAHIRVAARLLALRTTPLVVDPVMIASSGNALMEKDALTALTTELLPLATLVTPNLDEAGVLLGTRLEPDADLEVAATRLFAAIGCPVLLKGGHSQGPAVDVLAGASGSQRFSAPRIPGASTHGTGCTLSAAITAYLARGASLDHAVAKGKEFVTQALARRHCWPGAVEALDQTNPAQRTEMRSRQKSSNELRR